MASNVVLAQVSSKPKLKPKAKPTPVTKSKAVPVSKAVPKKPALVAPLATVTMAAPKTSFEKFSSRLKIGYFGVLTTPHLRNMKSGNWQNAAVSPQWGMSSKGSGKNQDTWPTNIWHQVSFNYNFGAKMAFVVNPRFVTPFLNGKDMKAQDRSFIMLDDLLVGFQGVFSSDDKKFNFWVRPGLRLPTSRASRNSGNAGAGKISNQLELAFSPTYDFNKKWQVGIFGMLRQWVIEDQYDLDRFRIISFPYVQYTIDDVSKFSVYFELIAETDRRSKAADDRAPVIKDKWQNINFMYGRDITPKLNISPTLGVFYDDIPITDRSVWVGAWISYQIK